VIRRTTGDTHDHHHRGIRRPGDGRQPGARRAFCRKLLEQGASKVYAGARNPSSVTTEGVVPVELDVTNPSHVQAVAAQCSDVDLLVNNAGISGGPTLTDDSLDVARRVFDTNVLGPLAMSKALAPVLGANGGGAIVNVLSVLAWFTMPDVGIYSASKAAGWQLTNALRLDLHSQGTQVVGLYVGLMDTDMTAGRDMPKSSPDDVAEQTLAGLEAGLHEVLADDSSRMVRAALSSEVTALYPSLT